MTSKNFNHHLWQKIIDIGREKEPEKQGVDNKFDTDDLNTILATMDFFGASKGWLRLAQADLQLFRYRLFDWLAMCVFGRSVVSDGDKELNESALKVLVHAYLKVNGDPRKFIEDLRCSDYEMDTEWEKIEIDLN